MQFKDLQKQYEILVSTQINHKNIFICVEKDSPKLCFLEHINGEFEMTDPQTTKQLNMLFIRPDPRIQLVCLSSSLQGKNRELYTSVAKASVINICDYTSALPLPIREHIIDNLRKVKFITLEESPEFVKEAFKNLHFAGAFLNSLNAVVVPSVATYDKQNLAYIIQHELLHCATYGVSNCTEGFFETVLTPLNSQYKFGMVASQFFNEALTEYINNIMHDKEYGARSENASSGYDIARIAMGALLSLLKMDKVNEFYFTSNVQGLVEYLCQAFHTQNVGLIYRMFSLFDLATLASINQGDKRMFDTLVYDLYASLFKTIIDLTVNKFVAENIDLKILTLNYFFPKKTNLIGNFTYEFLSTSQDITNYLESAKLCVKHLKCCSHLDESNSFESVRASLLEMAYYMAFAKPLPQDVRYNNLKTFEGLSQIVFRDNFIFSKAGKQRLNLQQCLKTILNPENNFLPKNKQQQVMIMEKFISSPVTSTIPPIAYLSIENLLLVCEKNPLIFKMICHQNFDILTINFDKMNSKLKMDKSFVNRLYKFLAKKTEQEAVFILNDYYQSFPLEERIDEDLQNQIISNIHLHLERENSIKYEQFIDKIKSEKISNQNLNQQ